MSLVIQQTKNTLAASAFYLTQLKFILAAIVLFTICAIHD